MKNIVKNSLIFIFLITAFISFVPTAAVFASTYGTGNYSGGEYKANTSNSSSSTSTSTCNDTAPTEIPNLFQINATNTSAKLFFTPLTKHVTYYHIAYGLDLNNLDQWTTYSFGASQGALQVDVNALTPKTTYYFKVKGVNGCASGNWGNTLDAKTSSTKKVIKYYQSTSKLTTSKSTAQQGASSSTAACGTYVVKKGDNLWKIARAKLGKSAKSRDIQNSINQIRQDNKSTYKSLFRSSTIRTGWQLAIHC